jgi:hypothetical protein
MPVPVIGARPKMNVDLFDLLEGLFNGLVFFV